jgi:polysaccharide biosynthesis/export protein
MRFASFTIIALSASLVLGGCASGPKAELPVNPANFAAPNAQEISNEMSTDYKFAPFDKMKVVVFRVADLSSEYRVEPSGVVTFPLVGSMKVTGLTSAELGRKLESAYGAKYLENPNITVQLLEATASEITVEGSIYCKP